MDHIKQSQTEMNAAEVQGDGINGLEANVDGQEGFYLCVW